MMRILAGLTTALASIAMGAAMVPQAMAGVSGDQTTEYFSSVEGRMITSTSGTSRYPKTIRGVPGTSPRPAGNTITLTVSSCTGMIENEALVPTKSATMTSTGDVEDWRRAPSINVVLVSSGGYIFGGMQSHEAFPWTLVETDPDGTVVHSASGIYNYRDLDGWTGGRACPKNGDQLCDVWEDELTCDPAAFGLSPVTPEEPEYELPERVAKKWSTKAKGKTVPQAKRKVAVTRTLLTAGAKSIGATVSYAWKVAGKTVGHGRSLRLRKSWRGKKVMAVVRVLIPYGPPVTHRIKFGGIKP